MTLPQLSIGIVGCGRMGRQHASTCLEAGHRIVFAADSSRERAEEIAGLCDGTSVATSTTDLDLDGVDAVIISTPPGARGPVEYRAAVTGTSFFVEKPVGLHSDQLRPACEVLHDSTSIHSVGYMNRYRESVREVRHALRGREVIGVTAAWAAGPYNRQWWSQPAESGGPFNEQCTHFVDLFRYYLGEIGEVAAIDAAPDKGHSRAVICRFASGLCGTLLYSCGSQTKQMQLRILCADGSLELSGYDLAFTAPPQPVGVAWRSEIDTFCRAVAERRPELVESSLHDALRTQVTVDSIARSIATGRAVAVETPAWAQRH